MLELLKIIHFLSFAAGIGAGLANMVSAAYLHALPAEAAPKALAFRLALSKISTVGLILLWLTGLTLIWIEHGTEILLSTAFLWKMAAVLALTAILIAINLNISRARASGTPPDPEKMKRLGLSAQVASITALCLAVVAFS